MATGAQTFRLGVNEFADLTQEEFASRMGLRTNPSLNHITSTAVFRNSTNAGRRYVRDLNSFWVVQFDRKEAIPKQLDWRANGAVTKPKNQGVCGNCWAHATAGAIEGVNALRTGVLTEVSVQQLVDCVRPPKYESEGCRGGYVEEAMEWAIERGLVSHASYPITGDGDSRSCKNSKGLVHIELYALVTSEEDLQYALQYGPVVAGVQASSPSLQHYASGIVSSCTSSYRSIVDHSALVVGYDEKSWIVKNSWGTSWGEGGFFRLRRGRNSCGIASRIVMALD